MEYTTETICHLQSLKYYPPFEEQKWLIPDWNWPDSRQTSKWHKLGVAQTVWAKGLKTEMALDSPLTEVRQICEMNLAR